MSSKPNIQDDFLSHLQKGRHTAVVITTNGYQIVGQIVAWDQFTLLVKERSGKQDLVYKSAISTITRMESSKA